MDYAAAASHHAAAGGGSPPPALPSPLCLLPLPLPRGALPPGRPRPLHRRLILLLLPHRDLDRLRLRLRCPAVRPLRGVPVLRRPGRHRRGRRRRRRRPVGVLFRRRRGVSGAPGVAGGAGGYRSGWQGGREALWIRSSALRTGCSCKIFKWNYTTSCSPRHAPYSVECTFRASCAKNCFKEAHKEKGEGCAGATINL
uniref:Uncharacterized protein n=1 Tax=Leersia perrieri TaxID=77586 RepID=A0A0D9XIK9_9ORYZ